MKAVVQRVSRAVLRVDDEIVSEIGAGLCVYLGVERGEPANALYIRFCEELAGQGLRVLRGVFGADMRIEQVNDGPVTIVL